MRDPIHTISASPVYPSPYPVSTRNYKKKDYDYLSNFSRTSHSQAPFSMTRSSAGSLQERSDCESDLAMTSSSVGFGTSVTSWSSTSSSQSYSKNLVVAREAEENSQHHHHRHQQQPQRHQQQHQHDVLNIEKRALSPRISAECSESGMKRKEDKVDAKDDKSKITGDAPSPLENATDAQAKVPGKLQSKPNSRPNNTPVVLPKFGSWDTKNPPSGDSYTLIFRRLRDEKQSGHPPVCTSPTDVSEEPEERLSQESKPKEPLHLKPLVRKDSTRQKAKYKSHQKAPKKAMRWNLCCKASALDD